MIAGISLVILAAVLQGMFLLPMSRTRRWAWEHIWLAFSVTGMLAGNWILSLVSLPQPAAILAAIPRQDLLLLAAFGIAWGAGAVFFGLGMDMLGLTLGYPIIMGLNASIGTCIPLLWMHGTAMFAGRRVFIGVGTAIAIAGIFACSMAGGLREANAAEKKTSSRSRLTLGLALATVSGILSCLPNVGLAFGATASQAARHLGASSAFASNAVWFIFFSFGGLVNVSYCAWLMTRHHNTGALFAPDGPTNWLWGLAMGAMWIASFYLYGMGTARLGAGGAFIGWPILISLSIGVGVLCGLKQGEWRGAPVRARTLLAGGLALLILAVLVIPFGTAPR